MPVKDLAHELHWFLHNQKKNNSLTPLPDLHLDHKGLCQCRNDN